MASTEPDERLRRVLEAMSIAIDEEERTRRQLLVRGGRRQWVLPRPDDVYIPCVWRLAG